MEVNLTVDSIDEPGVSFSAASLDETPFTQQRMDAQAAQFLDFKSSAIELLSNSGPDFMPNMFDVVMLCTDPKDQKMGQRPTIDFWNQLKDDPMSFGSATDKYQVSKNTLAFMQRVTSIEVPQPASDKFDIKFLFYTITKVASKVNLQKKATMKMRIDEPLYFSTIINQMSNNNDVSYRLGQKPDRNSPYSNTTTMVDGIRQRKMQVDLLVKHTVLMRTPANRRLFESHLGRASDLGSNNRVLSLSGNYPDTDYYWCFEDVKFLGMATDFDFDSSTQTVLEADFPFLFKRVYKVDWQYRDDDLHQKRAKVIPNDQQSMTDQQYWWWD